MDFSDYFFLERISTSYKLSVPSAVSSLSAGGGDVDTDAVFTSQLFFMVVRWVAESATFTSGVSGRSSKTRLAQRLALPLAPHLARLITFMLSPAGGRARLVPLSIVKEPNKKHVLLFIYNASQAEASQSQLYLQYIRYARSFSA